MIVSGKAIVAGVMGWPISHSRSPRLHGYWLDRYGIDGAYVPLPVSPENLGRALRALPALGYAGVNLTAPHKEAAVGFVDRLDAAAQRLGAVNTIVVSRGGLLEGSNTDGFGFLESLKAGAPGWSAASGPAAVIGAGGSSRAVCAALAEEAAPEVRIINRTTARAEGVAAEINGPCSVRAWAERGAAIADATLLVNATTLGMAGQPELDLDLSALAPDTVVTDLVYVPLGTRLLASAAARGNPTVDGLGMLLHQARPGFEAWFGVTPEVTPELRDAMLKDLAD